MRTFGTFAHTHNYTNKRMTIHRQRFIPNTRIHEYSMEREIEREKSTAGLSVLFSFNKPNECVLVCVCLCVCACMWFGSIRRKARRKNKTGKKTRDSPAITCNFVWNVRFERRKHPSSATTFLAMPPFRTRLQRAHAAYSINGIVLSLYQYKTRESEHE